MDQNATPAGDRLNARVVDLETLLMHLQRTLGELDQVVRAQQKQIEALERKIGLLTSDLNSLSSSLPDERKPEDEKPPHY
jgi:SlyX protein